MNKFLRPFALTVGLIGNISSGHADAEYVKLCPIYGAGFHYIPGTEICMNDQTGDARQVTEGGTWRSILPYPEGKWATSPLMECLPGKLVKVGAFKSTDFTLNAWNRKQTQPVPLKLNQGEFISKVIMRGGFYDPRTPNRHGVNGTMGLCLRSMDPNVLEVANPQGDTINPPFGNGMVPIGCVANSRIVNMPAAYAVSATSAYPSIDVFFASADQSVIAGPYIYGSQLVLTTDLGPGGPTLLTYSDASTQPPQDIPLAGTLSAWVCVGQGNVR